MVERTSEELSKAQEKAFEELQKVRNHSAPELPKIDDEKLKRDLAHKRVEKPGA